MHVANSPWNRDGGPRAQRHVSDSDPAAVPCAAETLPAARRHPHPAPGSLLDPFGPMCLGVGVVEDSELSPCCDLCPDPDQHQPGRSGLTPGARGWVFLNHLLAARPSQRMLTSLWAPACGADMRGQSSWGPEWGKHPERTLLTGGPWGKPGLLRAYSCMRTPSGRNSPGPFPVEDIQKPFLVPSG